MREAIAKAKERFQERCTGCKVENEINERAAALKRIGVKANHTCHGDLAAVRDCMLAAVEMEGHQCTGDPPHGPDPRTGYILCRECRFIAEIKRQFGLPEGSEGGKE